MSESDDRQIVVDAVGLSKTFRDFWNRPKAHAVENIDFTIRQGEVIGFLGPNGSGKSTTIKMMLGLLYPSAGTVSVFGNNPRDVKTKKRIGYLPEESYLYKYLTASETLDFYGALFNLTSAERKNRSEQLLEMVGLSHARNRSVGEFSKGMARRIGLAQAMINDPDLLILDEPTSGLDPIGCKEIKDLIMLLKERGKTVIVCSHLLSDIEDICDRVMILYGGKIRASGTLKELLKVSDATTITTPELPGDVMKKLLELLRKNLKENDFSIDNPRRTLEEFFLDVVDQAVNESVETSGVVSGGKIADYLQSETVDKERIIEELTKPEKRQAEEITTEKSTGKIELKEPAKEIIDELTTTDASKKETEKAAELEDKKETREKANEKLKHLLKGE
jgi:ABC-2 type transport system ATP-binding protein